MQHTFHHSRMAVWTWAQASGIFIGTLMYLVNFILSRYFDMFIDQCHCSVISIYTICHVIRFSRYTVIYAGYEIIQSYISFPSI